MAVSRHEVGYRGMKIMADLHTHTMLSRHAFSSPLENIEAARQMGFKYIGLTDHWRNENAKFGAMSSRDAIDQRKRFEKGLWTLYDPRGEVTVIPGVEFNLTPSDIARNRLDVESVPWQVVGCHGYWWYPIRPANFWKQYLECTEDSLASGNRCIAHPARGIQTGVKGFGVDAAGDSEKVRQGFSDLVDLCKKYGACMELNERSLLCGNIETYTWTEMWLKMAKERGVLVSLGTDAHWSGDIGRFDRSLQVLNAMDFPLKLLVNIDTDKIKEVCLNGGRYRWVDGATQTRYLGDRRIEGDA